MASAVGHIIGAAVVWEAGRHMPGEPVPRKTAWYLLPAALALAPDLDVLALIIGGSAVAHRGPSHSLVAAAGLAVLGALAIRLRLSTRKAVTSFAVLFACAAAHPALDYLMGCGPPVPFLWPFESRGWLSPVQVIPTAYYARSVDGLLSVFVSVRTWKGILLEIFSLGALWLFVRSRQRDVSLAALVLSGAGFGLTWLLYR